MDENMTEGGEDYYAEAASWAEDRERLRNRHLRLAWGLAAAAGLVAVCEAVALIALSPLKTVVPYTLLVDRQTGFVEALDPLKVPTIAPDAALTRSFLAQYVIAREGYSADTLQSNYQKTAIWSAGDARDAYIAMMQATNPGSPLNILPRNAVVQTRIESISPLGKDQALVRFQTYRADLRNAPVNSFAAVVAYRYSNAPLDMESRLLNPLGFQVIRYHRDAETPPLTVSQTQSSTASQESGASGVTPAGGVGSPQ